MEGSMLSSPPKGDLRYSGEFSKQNSGPPPDEPAPSPPILVEDAKNFKSATMAPTANTAAAIAAKLASLERGEKREQKKIPKGDWSALGGRSKKGRIVYKPCPGPAKCRNVVCNHETYRPNPKDFEGKEDEPVIDENTKRILPFLRTKCQQDGYPISSSYALTHLQAADMKLVDAINRIKADIDHREAAFRGNGRVCYESYEEATKINGTILEQQMNRSQAIPPQRLRDEAIAYLEDDDAFIKEFMRRGKNSTYGQACRQKYLTPLEKEKAFEYYRHEGNLRNDRQVFYMEKRKMGIIGEALDQVMKEYDDSVVRANRKKLEVDIEAREAATDDGRQGSAYNPELQPVVEDDEEYEDEDDSDLVNYEIEQAQMELQQLMMEEAAQQAKISAIQELAEARRIAQRGLTAGQIEMYNKSEQLKNQNIQEKKAAVSKFTEHFDDSAAKHVLSLFLNELTDVSQRDRGILEVLIATYNANNPSLQLPDFLAKSILTDAPGAVKEPPSNKGKGKERAVEPEDNVKEAEMHAVRVFAYFLMANTQGQNLLSPEVKTALSEEYRQYELRGTYQKLLQKTHNQANVQTQDQQGRKIAKPRKGSENLFKQMSQMKINRDIEEQVNFADKQLLKDEEERRMKKAQKEAFSRAIELAVEKMTDNNDERIQELQEELHIVSITANAVLSTEKFHYAGRPTGDPSSLESGSRTACTHPPSNQPPEQVPGRDFRDLQNKRGEGGKYEKYARNRVPSEGLCKFARSRYIFEPSRLSEVFRTGYDDGEPEGSDESESGVSYDSTDITANPPAEYFEEDPPHLADYFTDEYGDDIHDIHVILAYLLDELCDGWIDSRAPKKDAIAHVIEMRKSEMPVREEYVKMLIQVCGGSAAMTVLFLERANREFFFYFREQGIKPRPGNPWSLKYEAVGMQFVMAIHEARSAFDADAMARWTAEDAAGAAVGKTTKKEKAKKSKKKKNAGK